MMRLRDAVELDRRPCASRAGCHDCL